MKLLSIGASFGVVLHLVGSQYNVSGAVSPVKVGSMQAAGLGDLAISGHHLYSAGSSGLKILNISDPTQPFDVGYVDPAGVASQGLRPCYGAFRR